MAAARQGLPVRLDRAPQRGAAFALTRASRRARMRSIGSPSRARVLSLIFEHPPPSRLHHRGAALDRCSVYARWFDYRSSHRAASKISRSSATSSAALSLSSRRLYVAQRIRGGLSGVLVIGRVAAKPQAQLASAPEGSVILSLSLRGVGKLISAPRPKVTAAERQV
jgi:hypothetical protein